jgi:hypothetical protein
MAGGEPQPLGRGFEDFDGGEAAQALVAGAVDTTHRSATDEGFDLVLLEA